MGEISKKEDEIKVVRSCEVKIGALRRKEGGGNKNTRDKEDRKA